MCQNDFVTDGDGICQCGGYQIPTRGVFYCARMISSQMGTEFVNAEYDDIKKVYSIWICMNVPGKLGNAIAEYRMEKRDIIPGFPDIKSAYDKLSGIVIGLCDREKSSNELAGMLNVLLSPDIPAQDKKKQLAEKYDMKMEDGLGKEVERNTGWKNGTSYRVSRI